MMHAKKKKKLMYGKGGMAKLAQYMKGGRIYAENGDQVPDRSERITAYADDLSNNYGTTRGFGKALQDYMKVLNYLGQKSDHSAFSDEFSSRARNLFDDHFYRTDESASRDVTPESERDESLVDRARVNQFYRDLFQSALSEGGEAADRIFFMQENADKRRLLDEVDKDLSDFKNSPEGKQAAQMAGPMMSLVNQYSKGGTVKYRSGDMMKYPGGGLFPVRKVTSRQTLRPGMQYEYANPDNRQELIDQGFKFRTTPQGKTVVITPDGDRAVYRDRGELGTELKFKQSMALGGLVKKYQNGGVEGDPNKIDTAIDPTKNVSPRYP
jgi:hypothetical protein